MNTHSHQPGHALSRRATPADHALLRAHGLTVSRFGAGWTLRERPDAADPDGAALLIGDHGCTAPTQWEAIAEGLIRIRRGDYDQGAS